MHKIRGDILKRMNVEFTASDKGVKAILKEKLVNTIIEFR